jgi:hypothetical protein
MNMTPRPPYRLVTRGGAGLVCDEDGLALGAVDLARLQRGAGGMRRRGVRSPGEMGQILQAAFGPRPDGVILRLHQGPRRAAMWIEAGGCRPRRRRGRAA